MVVGAVFSDPEHPGFRFKITRTPPCAGQPEIFFAESAEANKAAALACMGCPFLNACRLEGLERGEWGVWGGLSHNQRSRMGAKARNYEIRRLRLLLAQEQHMEAS